MLSMGKYGEVTMGNIHDEHMFFFYVTYALVCRHDSNLPSNLSHFQLDFYGLMNQFYCPWNYEYWINDSTQMDKYFMPYFDRNNVL